MGRCRLRRVARHRVERTEAVLNVGGREVSSRILAAVGGGLLVGAFLVAWVAGSLLQQDKSANDARVGSIDVGDMSETAVRATLEAATLDPGDIGPISIEVAGTAVTLTPADLGISLDLGATTRAVMDRSTPASPWGWIGSHTGTTQIDPVFSLDRDTALVALSQINTAVSPVEPSMIVNNDGELEAVPGKAGEGLDVDKAVDALARALATPGPITVVGETAPRSPSVANADADAFVATINASTTDGITLVADDFEQLVSPSAVRAWLTMAAADGSITLGIDEEQALAGMAFVFGAATPGGGDATFDIVNGQVEIVGGEPAAQCCDPEAAQEVLTAVAAGRDRVPLVLSVDESERGRAWAESLGIVEIIGEFTTNYTPGQSRVTNIRRIAELTQGVVIEPGETFSVNDFIGRRTTENGFVGAGVIYNGIYTEDVGGGISQYATTLFNAAFFGGLDFGEYQSHSLPIGRYPYGREATLSFPHPDLQIINTTPHGVLLWPTTTASSITVRLYSTTYATGVQSGQAVTTQGVACDRVTTSRTRTFVDGHTEQDSVVAVYRPREGFNCAGEPTDPSFATTTTSSTTSTTTTTTTSPPVVTPPPTTAPPTTTSTTTTTTTTTTVPVTVPTTTPTTIPVTVPPTTSGPPTT